MAVLEAFGKVLVNQKEIQEKTATGQLQDFIAKAETNAREAVIDIGSRSITAADAAAPELVENAPIGLGNPLSVEILGIYTGKAPSKFLGKHPDLLITSAVKPSHQSDPGSKSINHLEPKIEDNRYYKHGGDTHGSPIVYYNRALDESTLHTTYEFLTESFPKKAFDDLAQLFQTAGALPIFAASSNVLVAGSQILSSLGKLGKLLFESGPFLREHDEIRMHTPNLPKAMAGIRIICNDSDEEQFRGFEIRRLTSFNNEVSIALVNAQNGKEYKGDAPYAVVGLDGTPRKELEGFIPKQASAELMSRFGKSDNTGEVVQQLESAVTLFNDLKYYKKAQEKLEELASPNLDEDKKAVIKAILEANIKNINNEVFREHISGLRDKAKNLS